jgi:hypothetical protein
MTYFTDCSYNCVPAAVQILYVRYQILDRQVLDVRC